MRLCLGDVDACVPVGVEDAVVVPHGLLVVVDDEAVPIGLEDAGGFSKK